MQIGKRQSPYNWVELRAVNRGECILFRHQFHQDMSPCDPYIKVDASAYPNRDEQGKTCAVNLRTGKMSYLQHDREVRIVDATVEIDE